MNGRRPKIGGFLGIDNILLLGLGVNCMRGFYVSQCIELSTCDLCIFFCLHQYKLKNIRQIFQNIPLAFTSCYTRVVA